MEIKLWKKPKNPIVIEGFPGFGLVGTIASEFLIYHLKTEQIGKIVFEDMPAMVAIHENKVVEPLGIFYDKKYNVIILHAITASTGYEWQIADILVKLVKQLNAKEVISLEGVGSSSTIEGKTQAFYYSNDKTKANKLEAIGIKPLKEGIIMGVTGALLLKKDQLKISAIFSETHSNLPDSKAAAEIIKVLDQYLGLEVDYKPLLEQAEKFEDKLRGLLSKTAEAEEISEKKKLSYVG
ncbi:proteasome assembly chaperone family protein [Candidatus Woesearchaeota archaeon]|nr:proteasome assembly chaperone family protein [Candidatus Woesearchaeota archaeon]